jgi:hypothetical protein
METTVNDFSIGLFLMQILGFLLSFAILFIVYRVLRKFFSNK